MTTPKLARGRPSRLPVETVRVVTWYYTVRRLSKLSESKLEIAYDELDRAELHRHRGSRWNKYKAGITTPGRDLLLKVGGHFPGSLQVFDHPLWDLAKGSAMDSNSLRALLVRLPPKVQNLFLRANAQDTCDFWMNEKLDHLAVGHQLRRWLVDGVVERLTALAGLLVLIHDGRMRQREAQHFETHLAIVALATLAEQRRGDKFAVLTAWRIESLLLQQWLTTNYADSELRNFIGELRAISSGPLVPWAPQQTSLKLGRGPNKKEVADLQASKGYWVGQRVLEWRELELQRTL